MIRFLFALFLSWLSDRLFFAARWIDPSIDYDPANDPHGPEYAEMPEKVTLL